jgi:hypothetical protein
MGAHSFDDLSRHIGHKVVCVFYGKDRKRENAVNVAIECETCNEVLLDFDKEPEDVEMSKM